MGQTSLVLGLYGLAQGDVGQVLRMLQFIELGNRDQNGGRLTVLSQYYPLVIVLRTGDKLVKVVTCLRQRECRAIPATLHRPADRALKPRATVLGCSLGCKLKMRESQFGILRS